MKLHSRLMRMFSDARIPPSVSIQPDPKTRNLRLALLVTIAGSIATSLSVWGASISSDIGFEDVTASSGISYRGQSWGASWADFNGDGKPDLWMSNHFGQATWHANQGDGTFQDVTSQVVVQQGATFAAPFVQCINPLKCANDTHGGAWADFDNDGDKDLVILSGAGPRSEWFPDRRFDKNQFLVNHGKTFADNPGVQDFIDRWHHGRTPVWVDVDNDGYLDFVSMAKSPSADSESERDAEQPSTIYRQTEKGFEDIGEDARFGPFEKNQLPFAFLADLAGTGRLQLVVKQNKLFVYDISSLPFVDITDQLFPNGQIEDLTKIDTDAVAADFDGDGLMDIYRTQFGSPGILLINTGSGFLDKTEESGLMHFGYGGKSVVAADFDNDMDIDLYIVNTTEVWNQPNLLYRNNGDGTFQFVPNAGGAAGPRLLGRGDSVSTADYDCDGFLDLFVTNGDWGLLGFRNSEGPYRLFIRYRETAN